MIPASVFISMAAPVIGKVVKEIASSTFTEENLIKAKEAVINAVYSMTGKTPFTWDDDFAAMVIKDLAESDAYKRYGDQIFDAVETVVANTATPWDDRVVLPAIEVLRSVAEIPDNDEK